MKRHVFHVKFNGESYDLKNFLKDHPGGVNTLKPYEGRSIKNAMQKFGHSASAYHMLNDLKVGDDNLTGELSVNGRIITSEDSEKDVEDIAFLEELEAEVRMRVIPQPDFTHYWVYAVPNDGRPTLLLSSPRPTFGIRA